MRRGSCETESAEYRARVTRRTPVAEVHAELGQVMCVRCRSSATVKLTALYMSRKKSYQLLYIGYRARRRGRGRPARIANTCSTNCT